MIVILHTYHERSSMFIIFFFFWKKGRWRKKLIIVLYRVPNIDWWIFLLLHFLCTLYYMCSDWITSFACAKKKSNLFRLRHVVVKIFFAQLLLAPIVFGLVIIILYSSCGYSKTWLKNWNLGCLLIRNMKTILHYANYSWWTKINFWRTTHH